MLKYGILYKAVFRQITSDASTIQYVINNVHTAGNRYILFENQTGRSELCTDKKKP